MILHYLKVALRNLLKYKTHSFISALCLAVGIVCYTIVCFFMQEWSKLENLPDSERRIRITVSQNQNSVFRTSEIKRLEEQSISGLEYLTIQSFNNSTEIEVIDNEQRNLPFLIGYRGVNSNFFSYNNRKLLHGSRLPEAPDEVVLSHNFASKAYGTANPIGTTIRLANPQSIAKNTIQSFKVVNVVEDNGLQDPKVDCYFSYEIMTYDALSVKGYLSPKTTMEMLNKSLQSITWQRGEDTVHPHAMFSMRQDKELTMVQFLILFIASLILVSGLINFLKFIIQMFYNRQREVALRKCMGSEIKGLFLLLFAEVFWMMSTAFLLSLVLTELMINLAEIYIPSHDMPDLPLSSIYVVQFQIYIALLMICMLVIWFPIRRLRQVSIISQINNNRSRHIFRSIMMWLQLGIAIFFVGSTLGVNMVWHEAFGQAYNPLTSEEEENIISLKVNSQRMWQHINPILSDIQALPECIETLTMTDDLQSGNHFMRTYKKADQSEVMIDIAMGAPSYFKFLKIPLQGKEVNGDAEGTVYVSEAFRLQLDKDNVQDRVEIEGQSYRIIGTFKELYKETQGRATIGSVFFPSNHFRYFYVKLAPSTNAAKSIRRITDICRNYVPTTLPLEIRSLSDNKQTMMGSMYMTQVAMTILAIVSILLVVLSIYSAISMDTVSRQKEIAIRKINGATPWIIAGIFGKAYLMIFLLAFAVAYPLVRLMLLSIDADTVKCIQGWDWGILLFFSVAFMIFLTTAYKIYRIMHINPAEIIKNE